MGCPMKAGACEKYGITPDQQKRFCEKGCSVICEEEFTKMCEKQQKVDEEKITKEKTMNKKEAIKIMEEHIDTLNHQLTGEGWKEMVDLGVVEKNVQSRLKHKTYTEQQIKAYRMAVDALKEKNN